MKNLTLFIRRLGQAGLAALATLALASGSIATGEEKDPYRMMDESWITISGTMDQVKPHSFTLDYGEGLITVEMDDGDRDADAYKLVRGDEVTVSGKIDDDFYEYTTIEASTVYVKNLNTTFFSSAVDEEYMEGWAAKVTEPVAARHMTIYGTVTDVDESEFTVDSGLRKLRVETEEMAYDPLDDQGYLKVRVGDRVKVSGQMDVALFDGRELVADSVIKLNNS